MHITFGRRRTAAIIVFATFAASASAEDRGWSVGIGVGHVDYAKSGQVHFGGERFAARKKAGSDDPLSSSVSLSLGYRFNRYVGLELGYMDNADIELSLTDSAKDHAGSFWFRSEGASLAFVGFLPLGNWEPYAKLGVLHADTEAQLHLLDGTRSSNSESGLELLTAIGLAYIFTEHWQAKLDFTYLPRAGERTGTGQSKLEVTTLGFTFRF